VPQEEHDWLNLGERQAESPGGAGQTLGGYRIRPNQISGAIHISRITNQSFQDKSGREGIQENDAFNLFKQIIIALLEVFEKDRNVIMYSFNKLFEEKNKEKESKRKAKEIAERKLEEEVKEDRDKNKIDKKDSQISTLFTGDEMTTLAKGYKIQEREIQERESELRLLRALASIGLVVTSFTHELRNLRKHLIPRTEHLRKMLKDLIDSKIVKFLPEEDNPFIMLRDMREQDIRLKYWLDYSLSALKKDKRKRINVDLSGYFTEFQNTWKKALQYRNSILGLKNEATVPCVIRAFKIDLDSIFNNLLANSLDAFKSKWTQKREITIVWKNVSEYISIIFQDTGPGLSKDFKEPEDIFLPFETSKRDNRGNKVGTGMGMYLVKTILEDYNAEIKILECRKGFKLKILLPVTKEDK
jgi:C4-dicarboxylate-specific signal transduction histidine kinase